MTLRHFQIFRTVCQQQSITSAAEKLNMTQPAVSIAMKELENFYQTKLFERMNRRIYITENGKSLLQYADTVLSQFDESVDVIRNDKLSMNCKIGVNVTLAETWLSQAVEKINKSIKNVELKLVVENTAKLEKMLADNELDFAVVDKLSDTQFFVEKLLYKEKMLVVCRDSVSTMTVAELSEQPLLLREKGSGSRNSVDAVFFRHGVVACPYMESVSTLSLIEMASNKLGFTILPESVVQKYVSSGTLKLVNISDDTFERYYHLIYHKNKYLTKTMQQVIDIICSTGIK